MKADWVSFEAAASKTVGSVKVLESDTCVLTSAAKRILAEDVIAPIDVPLWTNSAMDGYAVRSADVSGASAESPVELVVVDDIPAGGFPSRSVRPGEASRVMTGAPVPEGADSVIRVEHTDGPAGAAGGTGRVRILNETDAGKNLRRRGEDIRRGDVALPAGTFLSAAAVGVAASLGYAVLRVVRRPVVALLTSGNELVEIDRFDEVLAGKKIVSSNSHTLAAQIEDAGCIVRYLGIAEDNPESLRSALAGAAGSDALITSAGISVGEHDYVKRVLAELDTVVSFWRVRIRPGSPFAFGSVDALGGIPWFGLPGNPVSSMVTFELFVRPALLRMGGHKRVFRRTILATLRQDFSVAPGLTQFLRVRLEQSEDGAWEAWPTGAQGSGILTSVARADGLLMLPEEISGGRQGEGYRVIPLDTSHLTDGQPDPQIVGGPGVT